VCRRGGHRRPSVRELPIGHPPVFNLVTMGGFPDIEGPWLHKYRQTYYLSYSTGDTHLLAYAIGDNPYGPFDYKGTFLLPPQGWTSHHSIVEFQGRWYLFHHDSKLSGGKTHLRSIKVVELTYRPDGTIETLDGLAI